MSATFYILFQFFFSCFWYEDRFDTKCSIVSRDRRVLHVLFVYATDYTNFTMILKFPYILGNLFLEVLSKKQKEKESIACGSNML